MVSIDFYLNETSRFANLILPPTSVLETGNAELVLQGIAVRNLARYDAPIVPRTEGTRDDWQIMSELALRIRAPWAARPLTWLLKNLPERAYDLLLRIGPYKLSLKKLRESPHGLDLGPLVPSGTKKVRTRDGLVHLWPAPLAADLPRVDQFADAAAGEGLVLIGRRSLRSNNSWLHNSPSLTKGPDRSQLWINPQDAARLAIKDGAEVKVRSRTGELRVRAAINDDVMPGVVSLPHGFGHAEMKETMRVAGALLGASANDITDELLVEPIIGTSILNGVPVELTLAH
jgi:anaerobic selenocysteine-containing dehydrogenase